MAAELATRCKYGSTPMSTAHTQGPLSLSLSLWQVAQLAHVRARAPRLPALRVHVGPDARRAGRARGQGRPQLRRARLGCLHRAHLQEVPQPELRPAHHALARPRLPPHRTEHGRLPELPPALVLRVRAQARHARKRLPAASAVSARLKLLLERPPGREPRAPAVPARPPVRLSDLLHLPARPAVLPV